MLTGATHTTGIECPSFGQKESKVSKKNDRVKVVADEKKLKEVKDTLGHIEGHDPLDNPDAGVARTFVGHPEGVLEVKEPVVREEVNGQPNGVGHLSRLPIRTFDSGVKDTNPKDALGIKKAPLSTLPTGPMYEVALAMLEGARKYGRHNYRVMGVKASVYYDATMGHLTAWWEGEDVDPASGLHHLAKAMACLAVVRDSEMMGNWVDDRPPRYPDASKLMRNHPAVGDILKRYPECKKPFTWHSVDYTAPTEGGD